MLHMPRSHLSWLTRLRGHGEAQARYSPIKFDYFAYSRSRWEEYHRRKEAVLAAVDKACTVSAH